jgi:hypothetical protein
MDCPDIVLINRRRQMKTVLLRPILSILLGVLITGTTLAQTTTPPPPVWVSNPIVTPYPWPPEWTPVLYASVPSLTTSGQEFSPTTLLGGIQPCCSHLTYKLYQVNMILAATGNGACCHLLSDTVYFGYTTRALLRLGACFVLSQEPSMTIAEMMARIKDGMMTWTTEGFKPVAPPTQGAGAGGIPSGPGCATPPPNMTAAQAAVAYVDIVVN